MRGGRRVAKGFDAKLGEGGFGAVYEAEHPLLKRKAAVKVLQTAHRARRLGGERMTLDTPMLRHHLVFDEARRT